MEIFGIQLIQDIQKLLKVCFDSVHGLLDSKLDTKLDNFENWLDIGIFLFPTQISISFTRWPPLLLT